MNQNVFDNSGETYQTNVTPVQEFTLVLVKPGDETDVRTRLGRPRRFETDTPDESVDGAGGVQGAIQPK